MFRQLHDPKVIPVWTTCILRMETLFPMFLCLTLELPIIYQYFSAASIQKGNKESTHKTIKYLDFKNLNTEALLNDLRNSPWDSAFVFDDVDDTLDAFELLLNQALKEHIPFKQKRVRKLKQPDWINDRIISAIKTRDKELKKARKSNDPAVWAKYRRAKCFVTNLIRKSKRIYFQESIEKNKGNPNLESAEIAYQVKKHRQNYGTEKGE